MIEEDAMLHDPKWDLKPHQKVLLNAAQYIRDHGWCQHVASDGQGRVCLTGALYHNARGLDYMDATYAIYALIKTSLKEWNDTPGRAEQEVIAVLEKAAEDAAAISQSHPT
jgi:hypothetical protein